MMNYKLEFQGIKAIFNSKGAELISLIKKDREYIWQADPKFWNKHSPILFPIVGALKNDTYTFSNQEYNLSRHGFARDMEFEVKEKTENSITFSLKNSNETLKDYPFQFNLELTYVLNENGIIFNYKVKNTGEQTMYFSLGGHPAFMLNSNFENYSLYFENTKILNCSPLDNNLISDKIESINLTDNQLHLKYKLFENDALIFKNITPKNLLILENKQPLLKIDFEDFSDLGIWTKPNAPFICIEPWLGYADTFANSGNLIEKEGIRNLEANSVLESQFNIEILG